MWESISRDHHRVYIMARMPNRQRRHRIVLGEVRRHVPLGQHTKNAERQWRAFPADGMEFPPLMRTHAAALTWLKGRWDAGRLFRDLEDAG